MNSLRPDENATIILPHYEEFVVGKTVADISSGGSWCKKHQGKAITPAQIRGILKNEV